MFMADSFGADMVQNITVIGVGWFLGIIFVLYICFPFFCCLIETKRQAWAAFAVSLIYNFVCINYFKVGSSNILYSSCYFFAGGLIYLYREEIMEWGRKASYGRVLALGAVAVSVALYYIIGGAGVWDGITMTYLLVASTLLIYALAVSRDVEDSGGTRCWRTGSPVFSVASAWKSTSLIWRCSV